MAARKGPALKPITVVITNYKRPENLDAIVPAFRNQSVKPTRIIVVDNSPSGFSPRTSLKWPNLVDDVIRFRMDAGPCCRFAAIGLIETPLVLFSDDDIVPGNRGIETLLETGEDVGWCFATMGQIGRIYKRTKEGYSVKKGNIQRQVNAMPVDMTCRVHLAQTKYLGGAIKPRCLAAEDGAEKDELRNDDIFLSQGLQMESGFPSLIIGSCDRHSGLRDRELPAPHANCSRDTHRASRNTLVTRIANLGWRSRRG